MSEVKRYDMSGFGDGMIEVTDGALVFFEDHQSELAALREELDALKNHCADLEGVNGIIKKARDAAEQRNADFQEAALDVISNLGEFCCGLQRQSDVDYTTEQLDKLAALVKPTESGASE